MILYISMYAAYDTIYAVWTYYIQLQADCKHRKTTNAYRISKNVYKTLFFEIYVNKTNKKQKKKTKQ